MDVSASHVRTPQKLLRVQHLVDIALPMVTLNQCFINSEPQLRDERHSRRLSSQHGAEKEGKNDGEHSGEDRQPRLIHGLRRLPHHGASANLNFVMNAIRED